jgi:hypothetical protein
MLISGKKVRMAFEPSDFRLTPEPSGLPDRGEGELTHLFLLS